MLHGIMFTKRQAKNGVLTLAVVGGLAYIGVMAKRKYERSKMTDAEIAAAEAQEAQANAEKEAAEKLVEEKDKKVTFWVKHKKHFKMAGVGVLALFLVWAVLGGTAVRSRKYANKLNNDYDFAPLHNVARR